MEAPEENLRERRMGNRGLFYLLVLCVFVLMNLPVSAAGEDVPSSQIDAATRTMSASASSSSSSSSSSPPPSSPLPSLPSSLSTSATIAAAGASSLDGIPPPKTIDKVCWIHVQKASSWIGDYLVLQNCPHVAQAYREYRRTNKMDKSFIYDLMFQGKIKSECKVQFCPDTFGFHNPYEEKKMKGYVVAIFRHPMNRIISAYLYNNEMMIPTGMPWEERYPIYNARTEGKYLPIYQYVQLPGMTGCQTKLTLGHNCGAGEKEIIINKKEMDKAIATMRDDFAFVGLTEYPIETEKLYRAMYGGSELKHLQPQKIKYRENKKHTTNSHSELYANLTAYQWRDPIDEEFYDAAKKLFLERCELYKIPITTILPDPLAHPEQRKHE